MVYSASVAGGRPEREQDSWPPQSPVRQLPLPPLKEHPVRAHILPALVPAGTLMLDVWPAPSAKPPPTGMPAGQIVEPQLFLMLKVAALAPAAKTARRRKSTAEVAIAGSSS
uniref:Uncharacterized protein n=1 Tax=Triticum urartu TaxID=4572 RepID=A0A8R7R940_TRIUA